MISQFFGQLPEPPAPVPREGDLYKILNVGGHTFHIYYGYYEECDRLAGGLDPMPIYPDFTEQPRYTESHFPLVTKMQDACPYYQGDAGCFADCGECAFYLHGEDLIGTCTCPKNHRSQAAMSTSTMKEESL